MQDGLTDGNRGRSGDLHTALWLGKLLLPNCPQLEVGTLCSNRAESPGVGHVSRRASQGMAALAASGAQCPVCSRHSLAFVELDLGIASQDAAQCLQNSRGPERAGCARGCPGPSCSPWAVSHAVAVSVPGGPLAITADSTVITMWGAWQG